MKRSIPIYLSCLAILTDPGAASASTPPVPYAAASVTQALRLPDGSLIVAGNFTSVGEVARAGLAKLDASGQLDATWNPAGLAPNTAIQTVALASSPSGDQVYIATPDRVQDVYATGVGANVAGFSVTASGSVDGGNSGIRAIAADANGFIYIVGAFANIDSQPRNGLARVDSGGTLDAAWKPSANSTVSTLAVDSVGGLIYLGGAFVNVGGAAHLRLARALLSDGSVDATWTPSVTSSSDGVHHLVLSADGNSVIFSGYFTAVNGTARSGIAEVSVASGATDTNWNPGTGGDAFALAAASDFVYLGGDLFCCNQAPLTRVSATGTGAVDPTWLPAADGTVRALTLDGVSSVLAFGDFGYMGDVPVLAAAQLSSSAVATHALPDFERDGSIIATYSESTGAVVMAGDFQKVDQTYRTGLFRLASDASIDAAFVPPHFAGGGLLEVLAVAVDPSTGQVYAGGGFTKAGGSPHSLIARLDGVTGAIDPTWTTSIDALPGTGSVQAIAVAADGVYVGGQFTHVNGASRSNITKLSAAGALDAQFMGATNGAVSRIALAGSGVFIGGTFLNPRTRLARLQASDGSLDATWNPTFPWVVTWLDFFDLKRVTGGVIVSNQVSVNGLGGVVVIGELVQIDDNGQATILARFDQPVFDVQAAQDVGSVFAAGTFQVQYAINDFFAQTPHPGGLAQISLRNGTFGVAEAWSPIVPSRSGVPSLTSMGDGLHGALVGEITGSYPFPRSDIDLLGLPLGDFLLRDGFE